jgi:hypothetical protein
MIIDDRPFRKSALAAGSRVRYSSLRLTRCQALTLPRWTKQSDRLTHGRALPTSRRPCSFAQKSWVRSRTTVSGDSDGCSGGQVQGAAGPGPRPTTASSVRSCGWRSRSGDDGPGLKRRRRSIGRQSDGDESRREEHDSRLAGAGLRLGASAPLTARGGMAMATSPALDCTCRHSVPATMSATDGTAIRPSMSAQASSCPMRAA